MKKIILPFLLFNIMVLTSFTNKLFAQTTSSGLPVSISLNTYLAGDDKVAVSWTLLAQLNTDCFEVEKSNDGISWRSIAIIKAIDSVTVPFTYTVIDQSPLKGTNFYQVRRKDPNGIYTYTEIKNVRVNVPGKTNIYPNPSSNNVNIALGEVPVANWSVAVISSNGQIMTQKKYPVNITVANFSVDNYPPGNYIIEVVVNNNKQSNTLVVNNK